MRQHVSVQSKTQVLKKLTGSCAHSIHVLYNMHVQRYRDAGTYYSLNALGHTFIQSYRSMHNEHKQVTVQNSIYSGQKHGAGAHGGAAVLVNEPSSVGAWQANRHVKCLSAALLQPHLQSRSWYLLDVTSDGTIVRAADLVPQSLRLSVPG